MLGIAAAAAAAEKEEPVEVVAEEGRIVVVESVLAEIVAGHTAVARYLEALGAAEVGGHIVQVTRAFANWTEIAEEIA